MEQRIDYAKVNQGAIKAMYGLETYLRTCGLEAGLLHLIKMRVSQINGCAFCLDMHSKDMRASGETEQRLYLLDAWREAPFYSDRERAALEWAESLTLVSQTHVPDEVFERTRAQFTEEEIVSLSIAVVAINGWNRLSVAFRTTPGTYKAAAG